MCRVRVESQNAVVHRAGCAIKFCDKLNKFITETFVMVGEAYKNEAMSRTRVFESHKNVKITRKILKMNSLLDVRKRPEPMKMWLKYKKFERLLTVRLIAQKILSRQSHVVTRQSHVADCKEGTNKMQRGKVVSSSLQFKFAPLPFVSSD